GEVQAVANLAPDAVELDPAEVREVDATLQQQIFDEPTDRVIRQCRDDCRALPEAAAQPARDVVLPAAFINAKGAGGMDAAFPWIKAEHDFAQADLVEAALGCGFHRSDTAEASTGPQCHPS